MSSFIGLCTVLCVLVTLQSALCFGVSLRSARVRSSSSLYMGTTLVFGGTGKTGSECVYQSLQAGENVIVLARDPAKMIYPEGSGGIANAGKQLVNDKLRVIQGTVTDATDVQKCFDAATDEITGVVVALGGKTKDVGKTMLTDGTRNIIDSMKNKGVKRVAVVTSIGAGDSQDQAPLFFKALMFTVMKGIFEDKNNQEALFTSSIGPGKDLEYCIIRPGGLGVGAPTGVINVIDGQAGSIQRADVAAFCLGAITDSNFEYLGKTPCISSVGGTGWVKQKGEGFDDVTKA